MHTLIFGNALWITSNNSHVRQEATCISSWFQFYLISCLHKNNAIVILWIRKISTLVFANCFCGYCRFCLFLILLIVSLMKQFLSLLFIVFMLCQDSQYLLKMWMGTARVTLGIVDYWSILVRFVPLLSRTNSCIRFAPYLESAGRTASATLVLDCAHSSSIKSVLLKTQLRWVGHAIGMEEHCMPWGLT